MKNLSIIIIAYFFLGADSFPIQKEILMPSEKRPTIEQKVQLRKSKLQVLNAELDEEIAQFKNNQ